MAWIWTSGAARSLDVRAKPPDSATFDVSGPLPSVSNAATFASMSSGDIAVARLTGSSVRHWPQTCTWSWRLRPTSGRSAIGSISRVARCSAGPMPDSIKSCGEL